MNKNENNSQNSPFDGKVRERVAVRHLRAGDVIGRGDTIVVAYRGVRTPAGKMKVEGVTRDGRGWTETWNASTNMLVWR